jgi:hypothetical protein
VLTLLLASQLPNFFPFPLQRDQIVVCGLTPRRFRPVLPSRSVPAPGFSLSRSSMNPFPRDYGFSALKFGHAFHVGPGTSINSDNGDSDVEGTSSSPSMTSQFKKTKRTSKIWDHTPFGRNQIVRNTEGQVIWRCKYCKGKPVEYLESGGTSHIYKHLKSHPALEIVTPNEERAARTRNHLAEAFSRMSQNTIPLKRRRHDDEPTSLDADRFEQLYVEWVADCGVALRMATRESFRA